MSDKSYDRMMEKQLHREEVACCECGYHRNGAHHPKIKCPKTGRCGDCGNDWPCPEHNTENPYFNPDDYEFVVVGFYEELIDTTTAKTYGVRLIQEPDRPLGSLGRVQYTLTAPVTLRKGVNEVVLKASPQRPIKVWAMLQAICGSCKRSTK